MKKLTLMLGFLIMISLNAQNEPKFDSTQKFNWPENFQVVKIKSSLDGKLEPAYFYKTTSDKSQPLVVSLHTWSGDYTQEDYIISDIVSRNYNYIHPNFRGPNNNPDACGSKYVIQDIQDAIEYAIQNANVDPDEVHIVGTSGGGYLTLLCYMKLKYPVKSFSAWAPISNLEGWYWESVGRKQRYAEDILKSTESKNNVLNVEEAKKRSPIFAQFDEGLRKDSKLFIYEGIHDGYTGSVPITQSINMYNYLVWEMGGKNFVSKDDIINLVTKRCNPEADFGNIGSHKILYEKKSKDLSLYIFEGTHEQIVPQAVSLIPFYGKINLCNANILTLGDSNGAFDFGWPVQLSKLMPFANVINNSIEGKTIGFDNLDNPALNMLKNIDAVMKSCAEKLGDKKLDYVVIDLGTNDCKACFKGMLDKSIENYKQLLGKIEAGEAFDKSKTKIVVVTPTPIDEAKTGEKYAGAAQKVQDLNKALKEIADEGKLPFANAYEAVFPYFEKYTIDGVHLREEGQKIIAETIISSMNCNS